MSPLPISHLFSHLSIRHRHVVLSLKTCYYFLVPFLSSGVAAMTIDSSSSLYHVIRHLSFQSQHFGVSVHCIHRQCMQSSLSSFSDWIHVHYLSTGMFLWSSSHAHKNTSVDFLLGAYFIRHSECASYLPVLIKSFLVTLEYLDKQSSANS